jgi:hypothetical protein
LIMFGGYTDTSKEIRYYNGNELCNTHFDFTYSN